MSGVSPKQKNANMGSAKWHLQGSTGETPVRHEMKQIIIGCKCALEEQIWTMHVIRQEARGSWQGMTKIVRNASD